MKKNLKASRSIEIFANRDKVWDALVNPDKMKAYFLGTDIDVDWNEGGELSFKYEEDGQKYEDKGQVLEVKPKELIKYKYWGKNSGLEDKPENYSTVNYRLEQVGEASVKLIWEQEGFPDEDRRYTTEKELPNALNTIKLLAEKEERGIT